MYSMFVFQPFPAITVEINAEWWKEMGFDEKREDGPMQVTARTNHRVELSYNKFTNLPQLSGSFKDMMSVWAKLKCLSGQCGHETSEGDHHVMGETYDLTNSVETGTRTSCEKQGKSRGHDGTTQNGKGPRGSE